MIHLIGQKTLHFEKARLFTYLSGKVRLSLIKDVVVLDVHLDAGHSFVMRYKCLINIPIHY